MMNYSVSEEDKDFIAQVESCRFPVQDFDHRAHIRLAYIYLAQSNNTEKVVQLTREALTGLLKSAGIDTSVKYHETLTKAWILAVNHFMNNTDSAYSADNFIDKNSEMLDSKIMLTHYSVEVLYSDQARKVFVEPDLDPIPRHEQ